MTKTNDGGKALKSNSEKTAKLIKCPGCQGIGMVDNWVMGLGNSPEECQRCKGTGRRNDNRKE